MGSLSLPKAARNQSPASFAGATACPGAAELSSACWQQLEHLSSAKFTLHRLMLCGLHLFYGLMLLRPIPWTLLADANSLCKKH